MKLGKINKKFIFTILIFFKFSFLTAEEKIQSVPLINLEELSPTFEEDKDQLDQIDEKNNNVASNTVTANEEELDNNGQVFINLTALNKITAKTSFIKIAIGDKKSFGTLEIKGLKCQLIEERNSTDTVAYVQVKDLSKKDKHHLISNFGEGINFLFNLIEKKDTVAFNTEAKRKSISTEKTFAESLVSHKEMRKFLWAASVKISDKAKEKKIHGKTIQLKLKKDNFETLTRSLTLNSTTHLANKIYSAALLLLEKELSKAPFRLIGLSLENIVLENNTNIPDDLFNDQSKKLEDATDSIRKRYGSNSIYPGLVINK